ncbi:hypothetical protein GF377_06915 [candidate division GN15 bacterium]|nr:hypothetical protein [candidate division GN15 bacterium]
MLSESTRTWPVRRDCKDCWHLYSLQHLTPNRFANVVGQILRGRNELITTRTRSEVKTPPPLPQK